MSPMASITLAKVQSQLCSFLCKTQLGYSMTTAENFLIRAAITPCVFDNFFLVHLYFRCNPGWVYMRQVVPHCVVLFGLTGPPLSPGCSLYWCSRKARAEPVKDKIWKGQINQET